METLMASVAQGNQLEKKLLTNMIIGKMVNLGSALTAASLANALRAENDETALLLPFVGSEIRVVVAKPLRISPLFFFAAFLSVTVGMLRPIGALNIWVPGRQRQ